MKILIIFCLLVFYVNEAAFASETPKLKYYCRNDNSFYCELAFKPNIPKFKKGLDYKVVRNKLLKTGWKPYHHKDADECFGSDGRCINRLEMMACAGSGLGNCKFLWRKGKIKIGICTVDDPAVFDVVCPPE